MSNFQLASFLPELTFLVGALVLFFVSLGEGRVQLARRVALGTAVAAIVACVLCFRQEATLFDGAYRVDLFSQMLKLVFAGGLAAVLLLSGALQDIRPDVKPEYYLFVTISV